jgi:hypothetical protein
VRSASRVTTAHRIGGSSQRDARMRFDEQFLFIGDERNRHH